MKFQIAIIANGPKVGTPIHWTDETCSSRYGIGCISDGDTDYGPNDIIAGTDYPGQPGRTAAQICADYVKMDASVSEQNGGYLATQEQVNILRRFCSQNPLGPQVEIRCDKNGVPAE